MPDVWGKSFSDPLNTAILTVQQIATETASRLSAQDGVATKLFLGFMAVALVWHGVKSLLSEGDLASVFGGALRSIFLGAIVYWILGNGYSLLANGVLSFMQDFAVAVNPGFAGITPASAIVTGAQQIIAPAFNILKFVDENIKGAWNPLDVISGFGQYFSVLMVMIPCILAILLAGLVYIIIGIASQILVSLAIAIGPVFIVCMILPATFFMFNGWVRFLLSAALWKVIGAFLMGVSTAFLPMVQQGLEKGITWDNILAYGAAATSFAVVVALLMAMVPSIASALVGGHGHLNVNLGSRLPSRGGDKPTSK